MSKEYIFEIGDGLLNEETGEVCFKPTVKGELVRCKDCVRHLGFDDYWCEVMDNCDYALYDDSFCSFGERKKDGDWKG